jgi:hypothetical protein
MQRLIDCTNSSLAKLLTRHVKVLPRATAKGHGGHLYVMCKVAGCQAYMINTSPTSPRLFVVYHVLQVSLPDDLGVKAAAVFPGLFNNAYQQPCLFLFQHFP